MSFDVAKVTGSAGAEAQGKVSVAVENADDIASSVEDIDHALDKIQDALNAILPEVYNNRTVSNELMQTITAIKGNLEALLKVKVNAPSEQALEKTRDRVSDIRSKIALAESVASLKSEKHTMGATISVDYLGLFDNADSLRLDMAFDMQVAKLLYFSPKLQVMFTTSKYFKVNDVPEQSSGISAGADLSIAISKVHNSMLLGRVGGTIGCFIVGGKDAYLTGTVEGGLEYKVSALGGGAGLSIFLGGGAFCGLPGEHACNGMIVTGAGVSFGPTTSK